jgi:hypothetical protein
MKLLECVDNIFILAFMEDTSRLERALKLEGFREIKIIRPSYSDEELKYSRIARCLLNHENAWKECASKKGLSIVLEADFVPVVGFGQLPLPFPIHRTGTAWGHLYSCAQRVYEIVDNNFVRGHSAAPVAYVLDAKAAKVLMEFVDHEFSAHSIENYFKPWDTYIRMFGQNRGVNLYIPFRSYGEHGGIPNPEHKMTGINPIHRADVLWGRLHFLPLYSRGSVLVYYICRVRARTRAILRLLSGRFVEFPLLLNSLIPLKQRISLVLFGIKRLVSL